LDDSPRIAVSLTLGASLAPAHWSKKHCRWTRSSWLWRYGS